MTTDTISIDVFYRSSTGKLYAGSAGDDGKFTGAQVKDGKLTSPVRKGMNGSLVANVVGDPIEHGPLFPLPYDRYVVLDGNPAGPIPMNQFIEAVAKAEEKPGE